jgi:hypothetical protein
MFVEWQNIFELEAEVSRLSRLGQCEDGYATEWAADDEDA